MCLNGDIKDDKALYQVAEDVGGERWQKLASVLGFHAGQIASFKRDNTLHINDAIMDMLVARRNSFTDNAQCLPKLLKAINSICDTTSIENDETSSGMFCDASTNIPTPPKQQ